MGTQFLKIIFVLFGFIHLITTVFAEAVVTAPIEGLPQFVINGSAGLGKHEFVVGGVIRVISLIIQYTAVIAVIAVIYGGIQYILSFGADDKTKKAKWIIIYALVGVGISIAAYAMVAIVASISTYNL